MIETKERTVEEIEEELATVRADRERMEAALRQEQEQPLSWEMAKKPGALKKLAEAAQRFTHYPRIIQTYREREFELQREALERELEPLYKEREAAGKRLQQLRQKRLEMEEEILEAQRAWGDPHTRIERYERRLKDLDRQIRELRGES